MFQKLALCTLMTLFSTTSFAIWPFSTPCTDLSDYKPSRAKPSTFYTLLPEDFLKTMTLEQKVSQVFMVPFPGELVEESNEAYLQEMPIGNIIFYKWANGLDTKEQIKRLSSSLQKKIYDKVGIPAFISADQEGGRVFTLKPLTHFPSLMALGAANSPRMTRAFGYAMGKEMLELGVNLCLGPCVDVCTESYNPVIGTRSFGDNTSIVTSQAKDLLKGLNESGVLTVLKHAPGHGAASVDSHKTLPTIDKSLSELEASDFPPFKELKDHTDGMMSAHLLMPALDQNKCASLSMPILEGLIRKSWAFDGVIFSDSITMRGILKEPSPQGVADAAIEAFLAGNDCLIIGSPNLLIPPLKLREAIQMIQLTLDQFKQAVVENTIPIERLDAAVLRILKMKKRIQKTYGSFIADENYKKHEDLAWEVARKALTLVSDKKLLDSIDTCLLDKRVGIITPKPLHDRTTKSMEYAKVLDYVPEVQTCYYSNKMVQSMGGVERFAHVLAEKQNDLDIFIFLSSSYDQYPWQKELIPLLANLISPDKLIFIGIDHPQALIDTGVQSTHLVYLTYSSTPCSLLTVCEALNSRSLPKGKLPIQIKLPEKN